MVHMHCCVNLIKSHAWYHTSLITSKWMFTVWHEMLLNLVSKMKFYTFSISISESLWQYYIGFSIISFNSNLSFIMQLKQLFYIATKVCSRKRCYYIWWSTWLINVSKSTSTYSTTTFLGTLQTIDMISNNDISSVYFLLVMCLNALYN